LLHRKSRQVGATNRREHVHQSASQDAPKQTKFAQRPSTRRFLAQPIENRDPIAIAANSVSSRPTIAHALQSKPIRLKPMLVRGG
jgi:hypothetical protein